MNEWMNDSKMERTIGKPNNFKIPKHIECTQNSNILLSCRLICREIPFLEFQALNGFNSCWLHTTLRPSDDTYIIHFCGHSKLSAFNFTSQFSNFPCKYNVPFTYNIVVELFPLHRPLFYADSVLSWHFAIWFGKKGCQRL